MTAALVYLVAGMSSRFGGKIKSFAKVGDMTLIEHSLSQALCVPFSKIVFIVSPKTEHAFRDFFGSSYKDIPVEYAMQSFDPSSRDKPWGTVDAVCAAEDILDMPFILCNGDDLYGEGAFSALFEEIQKGVNCAAGYPLEGVLPEEGSVNRGIFSHTNFVVTSIQETFNLSRDALQGVNPSALCSMNIFGFQSNVPSLLYERLSQFKQVHAGNRTTECLLPTEVSSLISEGKLVLRLIQTDEQWYGVTNPGDETKIPI